MDKLNDIDTVLEARSAEEVWRHYVSRMAGLGFPHVAYHGARILDAAGRRVLDDAVLLTSYPARLAHEVLSQKFIENAALWRRWTSAGRGTESWGRLQQRRLAGRLPSVDERALDMFARHGFSAGYTIGLGDTVQRVRAVVIVGGPVGTRQDRLDEFWRRHGETAEALTGLLHLRLSTLPYAQPEGVLTLRQREVLECISVGRTTQEIAELLDVTPATVEKHLRLARKALGARTTAQAVLLAVSRQHIFTDPGDFDDFGESADAGPAIGSARPREPVHFTAYAAAPPPS